METIWNSDDNEVTELRANTPAVMPFGPEEDDPSFPNLTFSDESNHHEPATKKVGEKMMHRCPGSQQPRWIEIHPRKAGEQIQKGKTVYNKLKTKLEHQNGVHFIQRQTGSWKSGFWGLVQHIH